MRQRYNFRERNVTSSLFRFLTIHGRSQNPRAHFGRHVEEGARSRASDLPRSVSPETRVFALASFPREEKPRSNPTIFFPRKKIKKFVGSFVPSKRPPPPPSDGAQCCNGRRSCKQASCRPFSKHTRPESSSQNFCYPLLFPREMYYVGSSFVTLFATPSLFAIASSLARSRLSRDYSRKSTTGTTRARAALTLAFSTRLFLSLSSLSGTSRVENARVFIYVKLLTPEGPSLAIIFQVSQVKCLKMKKKKMFECPDDSRIRNKID